MRFNFRLIQAVSDALIPIFGYLFWGWKLVFILLYYILDLLISEVFLHFKSRTIRLHQGGSMMKPLGYILLSMAIHFCTLLFLRLFLIFFQPDIDFKKEIVKFWAYEDLGIAQGYLLLPLLILVGYLRYRMEFVKQGWHQVISIDQLWKKHISDLLFLLAGVSLLTGISFFVIFPEWVYLSLLLVGTTLYQLRR